MSFLPAVRHISFDAWNTLIEPNPMFSHLRSQLIAERYDIPYEKAKAAYTATKRFLDTAAELTGFGTNSPNVYRLLNAQLRKALNEDELVDLAKEIYELFEKNPPSMPEELVEQLKRVKALGYTMNILSNTNYVPGTELIKVFDSYLGVNFFEFALFSDAYNMAKPHYDFFSAMHGGCWQFVKPEDGQLYDTDEIVHIGDNVITDVQGGRDYGVETLLVASPADLAEKLKLFTNDFKGNEK